MKQVLIRKITKVQKTKLHEYADIYYFTIIIISNYYTIGLSMFSVIIIYLSGSIIH